ncbi:MAG: hypothetical protein PVH74_14235 [Desulfobacterales bacterium]|jgi:hypothetical protein
MENRAVSAEEKNPESKSKNIKMTTWFVSMNAVKSNLLLERLSPDTASDDDMECGSSRASKPQAVLVLLYFTSWN